MKILNIIILSIGCAYQSICAQNITYKLNAEINSELQLEAKFEIEFIGDTKGADIELFLDAAGKDSLGSAIKVSKLVIDDQGVVLQKGNGWLSVPKGTRKLTIEYGIDLAHAKSWTKSMGYAVFPSNNSNNSWYPDIYIDKSRNFQKDFGLELTYPDNITVLTSGRKRDGESKDNGSITTFHFAENIEYFALNVGKNFIKKTVTVDEVELTYICDPKYQKQYETVADVVVDAIDWFTKKYGFFPKKYLGIAMGHPRWRGGFPSENMFYIHRGNLSEAFLQWITSHELGHYYWGYHVQTDAQDNLGHLMLANGIWIDQLYVSEKRNIPFERLWTDPSSQSKMLKRYLVAVVSNYEQELGLNSAAQQNLEFDYNSYISHGKAATGLYLIANQIGIDAFLKVQKKILQEFGDKTFYEPDFKNILVQGGWEGASRFIDQWNKGNAIIEYNITGLKNEAHDSIWRYTFDLVKAGTVDYPIEIEITDTQGNNYKHVSSGTESKETITGESEYQIENVLLDPRGMVPMWNSDHRDMRRLYIMAMYESGHTRPAMLLGNMFLKEYPNDSHIKKLMENSN
ncbi:hypothetical protein [Flagellimonas allohymeniacidonis]|uniref:Peptidase M1 membrane alanine aminopeptidase domain-containing protein n=1 Tax=Flagellimonas allohymeniacidonis TaxID=2517819 RepID=A0A4Q8QD28_9FLAO|nr:hypothetical protein [Allomuricauda hymeniacidonis]TAI48352.1 hypothetical protein EW142_00650 [Allomuricauda hymeniacidonis]